MDMSLKKIDVRCLDAIPVAINQLYWSSGIWVSSYHICGEYIGDVIVSVLSLDTECQRIANCYGIGGSTLVEDHQSNTRS